MRRFSKVIDDLELVNLPLSGGNFKWRGGLLNHILAHLDIFLVSLNWLDHLGNVMQLKLPRPTSDHAPIDELKSHLFLVHFSVLFSVIFE